MFWTVLVFSLLCDMYYHAHCWTIEPTVFTVFRDGHTWNEAREICRHNNNTLLTIPDENYWTFWKFVLSPEGEAPHRDNSRYWFGLHAPDPSDMTSLRWADCTAPSWIEWRSNGRNYIPDHPCLAFDVYFKPFSTVLLKIWLAESCPVNNYFVCSEPLTATNGECITHGCDEYVRVVSGNNECENMCTVSSPDCRTNFTIISGLGICHVFSVTTIAQTVFNRVCFLTGNDIINPCTGNNGFGDTSDIVSTDPNPSGICLTQQQQTTSSFSAADTTITTEVATTADVPTTEARQTTSSPMCVCTCNNNNQPELTLEEKVEQIKRELTVNKKNTSLHKRKFISASDDRMSATGIGSFGVGMLVAVLLSICIMDLGTLKADLQNMLSNIRSCFCRDKDECHVRHVRHVDTSKSKVEMFISSSVPVVLSSTSSPVKNKSEREDIRGDLLSVPKDNGISKTYSSPSPSCSGSTSTVTSRSSSNRSDRASNISPKYNGSLSKTSSNTSHLSRNTSKSSARSSSGVVSVKESDMPSDGDIQLSRLSKSDRDALVQRITGTDIQTRHKSLRSTDKEPTWLGMV
ncbi:serine-rich adhesin for platelets-like [Argopecten irradians]|uniref:serine-rich adhesin for platelets-like n=1 Tax=Argopecten irradians TaxID=31199 RepID=UPI0037153AE0